MASVAESFSIGSNACQGESSSKNTRWKLIPEPEKLSSPVQVRLRWLKSVRQVLVVKKRGEAELTARMVQVLSYLLQRGTLSILVEPRVYQELQELVGQSSSDPVALLTQELLKNVGAVAYDEPLHEQVDLCVCLGGDGTLMHMNSLFPGSAPPTIAFNCGTLGFLTPFDWRDHRESLDKIIQGDFVAAVRNRLECRVYSQEGKSLKLKSAFTALNEAVVDRGVSPYLCSLDVFCDNLHVTRLQADGAIIATTTGSTAYSLSAGGSMVHPSVSAILFTPICAHSLSCRPLCMPDSVVFRIQVHQEARSSAWVSFDGRARVRMDVGDVLVIRMSPHSLVCASKSSSIGDWFQSLAHCLRWNDRVQQKSIQSAL